MSHALGGRAGVGDGVDVPPPSYEEQIMSALHSLLLGARIRSASASARIPNPDLDPNPIPNPDPAAPGSSRLGGMDTADMHTGAKSSSFLGVQGGGGASCQKGYIKGADRARDVCEGLVR